MFDDGNFSENETFLLTDWFAHTPRDVLAKNFGVPESAFANLPTDVENKRYIFESAVPGPIASGPRSAHRPAACRRLQPRALRPEADPGRGRRGEDRGLEELPGGLDDRRGPRRDEARRDARAALAPERRTSGSTTSRDALA